MDRLVEQFNFVPCSANKENIPSLVFAARPSELMSEDESLSHWMSTCADDALWPVHWPRGLGNVPSPRREAGPGSKGVVQPRVSRQRRTRSLRRLRYVYAQDARPDYACAHLHRPGGEPTASFAQTAAALVGRFGGKQQHRGPLMNKPSSQSMERVRDVSPANL